MAMKGSLAVDRMTDEQLIKRLRIELANAQNAFCPGRVLGPGASAILRAVLLAREIEMRGTQLRLTALGGGQPPSL